jgi:resuscitation-promoting factor RpfA
MAMSEQGMGERDPRVSRAYREEAQPGPDRVLDARILAAARQAVSQPRPRRGGWRRFAVPISAVAVAVVATTLALLMEQETQRPPTAHPPLSERTAEPALGRAEGPKAEAESGTADEAKKRERKAVPESRHLPKPAAPAPAKPPAEAVAPAPAPSESFPERADQEDRSTERAEERPRPAAPATGSAPSVVPFPAGRDAAPAAKTDGAGIGVRSLGKARAESPEAMVERIRMLRKQGREAEAQALLDELRRRYPDFPLPQDLR